MNKMEIAASFKEFLVKNGVVSTAASITIGFATATFIKSFVADVVMPLVFLLAVSGVGRLNKATGNFISQFLADKEFKFTNFVSEAITWVLIIGASFLVLDLFVRKTLGSKTAAPTIQQHNIFSAPVTIPSAPLAPVAPPASMPQPMANKPQVREEYGGYAGNSGQQFAMW